MNKYSVRGKIAAGVCAAGLALALPMMALAVPSPSNSGTNTGQNNVTANVTGTTVDGETVPSDYFEIVPTDTVANGAPVKPPTAVDSAMLEEGETVTIASFKVNTSYDPSQLGTITVTLNVGTQYSGASSYIYVEHNDGTTEVKQVTVGSDGTVTLTTDDINIITVAIDTSTIPEGSGVKADKGATSPQTGVSVLGVAAGTGAMAVAACGTGAALRKKVRG